MKYRDENGEDVDVRIFDNVKADWVELVDYLGLPDGTVSTVKAEPGWNTDTACRTVFTRWLSREGREPITWATLIQVLGVEMTGYKEFVKKIKLALDNTIDN